MATLAPRSQTDREARARERDIRIRRLPDKTRRRAALADVFEFCSTYFRSTFYQPWTPDRVAMVEAILHAARYVGDQAIAGPRGEGKTRSALFAALFLMLRGESPFPLVISKSSPRAKRELKNLKQAMTDSKSFAEDFPEVMDPILALEGNATRARMQTYGKRLTQLEWADDILILPKIPTEHLVANGWNTDVESCANGAIIASLGIDGPIRGFVVRNKRPTLAIIDDIDDRESARSELQTDTRVKIIDEDIAGCGGPGRTISRVYLNTLLNHDCCAAIFTDPKRRPSWRGKRQRWVYDWPARADMWEKYLDLLDDPEDPDGRKANAYYVQNQVDMDQGARVSNPHRFDSRKLKDGTPYELSAIQAAHNMIFRIGKDAFFTEYQNEPPETLRPIESGITSALIRRKTSGYARGIVPTECDVVTAGVDVGKRALHWVVKAWEPAGTGYVIDYGVESVIGTVVGSDEGVEHAIQRAMANWWETRIDEPYQNVAGDAVEINQVLIDARWQPYAVALGCQQLGTRWLPAMGHGKSAGCIKSSFHNVTETSRNRQRIAGAEHWYFARDSKLGMVVHASADYWKSWTHARWLVAAGKPGSLYLFDDPTSDPTKPRGHMNFAAHLTSEIEIEDPSSGVMVRKWVTKPGRGQNHYFDASYWACVAASVRGVSLYKSKTEERRSLKTEQPAQKRMSLKR